MNQRERRAQIKAGSRVADGATRRAQANALLADALRQQAAGRQREALARFRQVVAAVPDLPLAHAHLGAALCMAGQFAEAIVVYRRALTLAPDAAVIHNNLGNALAELGSFDDAAASYQRALALAPSYAEAHNNLGNCYRAARAPARAIASYRQAIALKPNYAAAHNNLGAVLLEQGELDEAITSLWQALRLVPRDPEPRTNLGIALRERGEPAKAVDAYRAALGVDPNYVEAYNNLGVALHDLGRLDHAVAAYRAALRINSDLPETLSNLGISLREQGLLNEAISAQRKSLALRPDRAVSTGELIYTQSLACDWREADNAAARLIKAAQHKGAVPPFFMLSQPVSPAEQLICARQWVAASLARARPGRRDLAPLDAKQPPGRSRKPADRKIRVAYLSADFCDHPVAHAIVGVIEAHDSSRFETIGVYAINRDDEMSRRLNRAFSRFIDIGNSNNDEATRSLKELQIDIAIDLTGHTRGSRSVILAGHPAALQVNYFGYSGTMGADFIDYLIADRFTVPEDEKSFYSEQVVYLPDTFLPTTQQEIGSYDLSRAAVGLPEGGFVFCSFANTYKINPPIFEVWATLLKKVEGSVLWLLEANAAAVENLRREAEKRGVAGDRLVFAARVPHRDHLARHRLADLMLDTVPYNAHTTAADSLWVGLPIVTCRGRSFAGRVAGSALHAAGLPDLVAQSLDEYETLALDLATDHNRLAAVRNKLVRNRETSPLFDTARLCRHIESAFETMWQRHQRGKPPVSFSVAPMTQN